MASAVTRGLPTPEPTNAARIHQDCHKTGAEKAALLAEIFKLPRYTSGPNAGKPMGVGKLEIKHKVAPGYISQWQWAVEESHGLEAIGNRVVSCVNVGTSIR